MQAVGGSDEAQANATRGRRPKFLMRRRVAMTRELPVHRAEREIIARN